LKFTKMHGAANDYVYVNGFEEHLDSLDLRKVAIKIADRHTGVGGDGLVLILPSETCDFRMRMFNMDGSEAEMCGNAVRCVGKYVYDHGLTAKRQISLETLSGVKQIELFPGGDGKITSARVNMGAPVFEPGRIPVDVQSSEAFGVKVEASGREWVLNCVSMGNPHAVTLVEDPAVLDLDRLGPPLENHPIFPRKCNIEFTRVLDRQNANMRVWERGSGETMACGTGACATAVALMKLGLVDETVNIHLRGGTLTIEWPGLSGSVFMTGPAVEAFTGEIDL
jgi:diaminopimelate epimerase